MAVELSLNLLKQFKVFDPDSEELGRLYQSAVDHLPFAMVDYLTIRDIVQLSGHKDLPFHLLLLCLFIMRDTGSICLIFAEDQIRGILDTYQCYDSLLDVHIKKLFISPLEEQYPDAIQKIGDSPGNGNEVNDCSDTISPLILRKEENREYLYFMKYYHYEHELETHFHIMLNREETLDTKRDVNVLKKVFITVTEEKPLISSSGKNILLNKQQRLSVLLSMIKDFVIISGGPGTGKTSIIASILRALVRLKGNDGTMLYPPESIRLAAPTGRAARRITDSMRNALHSLDDTDGDLKRALELDLIKGETLHRLLRYSPQKNSFTYNKNYHLPAKVVIVDEVSMVDVLLMSNLAGALAPDIKLILLGDKNQLPSVDAGAVLADLIPDTKNTRYTETLCTYLKKYFSFKVESDTTRDLLSDRIVILDENYRSTPELNDIASAINQIESEKSNIDSFESISTIQELSKEIGSFINPGDDQKREGTVVKWPLHRSPELNAKSYSAGGCRLLIPTRMPDGGRDQFKEWFDIYESWIYHHFCESTIYGDSYLNTVIKSYVHDIEYLIADEGKSLLDLLFLYLDESRILTLLRHGPFGCSGINAYIQKNLSNIFDPHGTDNYFSGAPIVITRNDYRKELFNGDVGIVLRLSDNNYYAFFKSFGEYRFFPVYTLPDFELAFAITVHKGQGSEYKRVLMVLPPDTNQRLLTREIIYTGLTRAQDLAVLHTPREVLTAALKRKIVRFSGISLWKRM